MRSSWFARFALATTMRSIAAQEELITHHSSLFPSATHSHYGSGVTCVFDVNGQRVALVTDTACDLSDEQLRAFDIRTIPLRVSTSKGEFRDRLEISPARLYEIMEEELPKTSLPLPGDVADVYRQCMDDGADRILHIAISSGLSGTHNMATIVAEDFAPFPIDVVDSKTLSAGEGLLVLDAARCLQDGGSVEDAVDLVRERRKGQLGTFVIRTLEYLRKGGRIGLVEGVLGSLLQIKPVIYVNDDGIYDTLVKARGFGKALTAMKDSFFERYRGRRVRVAIVHGNAE